MESLAVFNDPIIYREGYDQRIEATVRRIGAIYVHGT